MAEVAKALQERKAAKAKFTRKKNAFFTAVAKKENMGDIEGNFNELTKAWRAVEGKHDNYIILLEADEAPEKEEAWINELQNTYSDANSIYNRCASENLLKAKEDEMSAKFAGLAKKKASLEAMFKSSFEQVKGLLTPDSTGTIATASLKKCESDLATIFNDCKSLHDDIIALPLEARYIETEIEWIRKLHAQYSDIASQVEYYSDENLAKQRIKSEQINYLQMEKAKLPTFNADIRNYPRFKSDFMTYVLPTTNRTSAPYILRSCLTGEPLESSKSVDDNLDEMWARLDEKYGDPTKITDVVINAIQNCKPIKEGESRKLLEFITTVEDGYRDLKRLGLQSEITTTSSVSIIERKLPNDIKKEWSKIVCSTTIDKSDKFSNLLTFLLEQRKIIEYETSELRATNQSTEEATNYVSAAAKATNSEGKRSTSPIKCIIHDKGTHGTSECKVFLAKTVEERKQTLKDKKACWSCLRTGHRYKDCKRKNTCGKNGCIYKHHQTLHEDKALTMSVTPSGVSGTINACQQIEKSVCIFQVQRIRTKKSWINVMWDSAASLCFITNEKAKAEKLQGKEVELTITKVGGETEKLQTYKYNLPLIDLKGDQVILEVYGIDKITNDIQGIKSTFIASMFNNVLQKDINRPEGKVDVLIGYQYAAYHPQKEQNNGHLLLLENRFGKCVGGSHPMIKETTQRLNEIVDAKIHLVDTISINDFYQIENLGIECKPKCGGCKCGKCAIGSKNYSLREERELHLIENNLKYDKENKRWIAQYPWVKDPNDLPDNRRVAVAKLISTEKRSSYTKLLRVTARILAIYKKSPTTSFKNATKQLLYEDILTAETFWIIQVQQEMESDIQQGRYKRLCVRKREDQIYVVGHRTQRWVEMSYNKSELILLSYQHRFSRLYVEYIHQMGHLGVSATACKVRAKFWIVKLHKLVKSIKSKCVTCRKIEKKTNQQVMGQLPEQRLKPSPAWNSTAIDLFGPFKIRDEVKKRTFGKAYGVIFNCLSSRAVHIDIAPDYSTETFLMVFRRFVSLRGYPTQLYSDNGPQLVSANNELINITKNFNQEQLQTFGVVEGFQWKFTPADAPWQNGISEALIKTVKRALTLAIGDNTLTFSELQTVCYEVANLVNERPIGRHPTSPEDGTYLSPNDLLLGRSSSRIPSGPFKEHLTLRQRFEFVQSIINRFWKKWISDYFPSLIIRQKWHTATRNVRVGDIVLVADSNVVRGEWKLARVNEIFPGKDGQVRKVTLKYKNPRPREPIRQYKGHGFVTIDRPVHKLVVLVPIEEQNS